MGNSGRRAWVRIGAVAAVSGALAAMAALTPVGPAGASVAPKVLVPAAAGYRFVTLGSDRDATFNELLGINKAGVIAGYFGSGTKGHPNKGYVIDRPYAQRDFIGENYPHSAQTQVTGLNDDGVIVGFYATQNSASLVNGNFGCYEAGGHFHEVNFPTADNASPPVNQLLGVNDHDVAVGFYVNSAGEELSYTYNINTKRFTRVLQPGVPPGKAALNLIATAINNDGDLVGFYLTGKRTNAFLLKNGHFTQLAAAPNAVATQAFGVNDADWVVGTYTTSSGATYGFLWRPGHPYIVGIEDPKGIGTTTLNGINDQGDLVGFYIDSAGNTDGFIAYPES